MNIGDLPDKLYVPSLKIGMSSTYISYRDDNDKRHVPVFGSSGAAKKWLDGGGLLIWQTRSRAVAGTMSNEEAFSIGQIRVDEEDRDWYIGINRKADSVDFEPAIGEPFSPPDRCLYFGVGEK
jgi:hypothetical protein